MSAISLPYLGKPGAMRRLPAPRDDVDATFDRSDDVHTSMSGGTGVVRVLHGKRSFTLPYPGMASADAELLQNFYRGIYGVGPWRFVDPSARNMLGMDVATFGVRPQVAVGWTPTAGAVSKSTTPPAGAADSGVASWVASAAGKISPGATVSVADTRFAPVYLPGEPCTVSVWLKVSASSTLTLTLVPFDSAGVLIAGGPTSAFAMTTGTGWRQFVVTAAAGAGALSAAYYVLPMVTSASAATVSLAGAQLEYADAVSAWQVGASVPRVSITAPPGRTVPQIGTSSHVLNLAEV